MAAVRAGAILVFLSVFPGSERVSGQRAPCYECEDYKENHPQTSPYQQIRTHCSYPCECDEREPTCPPDVSVIRDGCGCCPICAGQLGQPCDGTSVCDDRKGFVCRYPYSEAAVGICQATTGLPCMVFNKTYSHGETFQTDCRTQCSCQNGTYACSSLCPNENISPRGACTHPRLVEVPDQCCREWMCDSTEAEHPPVCKQQFTSWSPCSAECGLGLSRRVSNLNQNCILQNETRICQLRPCEAGMLSLEQHARHRHIRKGHECKATQRVRGPVRLRFGPCRSKKRYRPKFCGSCDDKLGDGCCTPQLSTTIKVEFICSSVRSREDPEDMLLELIEPGRDLWWPDDLLAIGKQRLTTPEPQPNGSYGSPIKDWMKARDNEIAGDKKVPYPDVKSKEGWASKSLPIVSEADANLLHSKDRGNEPLLGGDVLIYEPVYAEKDHRNADGTASETVTATSVASGKTDVNVRISTAATEGTTTQVTTTDPTTPKPKKKRKKKPRKAFTSWLEFRDEEYQMDEYEDEDEAHSSRKKRSPPGRIAERSDRWGTNLANNHGKRRYTGSFREGYLEELKSKDDDYEDEDENEEDEDSDEEEDDEDEESESEDEEDEEEEEEVGKRNRSQKKPVFYAFYRKKREASDEEKRSKVSRPKKYHRTNSKKGGIRSSKKAREPTESSTKGNSTDQTELDRVTRITREREVLRERSETRKRKGKKMREMMKGRGKDKPRAKESGNEIPEIKTGKSSTNQLVKIGRILTEQKKSIKSESVREGDHTKNKTVFHTAGKVHRFRTRRHAPRPPWPQINQDETEEEEEEEEEEEDDSDDLTWGDHTVSFSVQWIVKCRCDRDCGLDTTTVSSGSNNLGEVILRRVHRTAPP